MNLLSTIYAIRRYGIKGVYNYALRFWSSYKFLKFLKSRILPSPPVPGITLIGCLDYPGSLSKVMRDLAILLKKTGIPFQVLNLPCATPIPLKEYQDLLTDRKLFVTNKFTHIVTMRQSFNIPAKGCSVHAIEFWEFEDGYKESQPEMLKIKNIVAMSDFNLSVFKKGLRGTRISKILYPFQFSSISLTPPRTIRERYNIPLDSFMVFFNFDFASSYFRKNPEATLRAFSKAFSSNEDAVLVFKTMRAKQCKAMRNRLLTLAQELDLERSLILIDDFIPQEDLVNLTNACDVYMSLHRGEGFGLGIAEAMSLGKPVIVTNYSSTTEFCNVDNAMLIPYKMVPVKSEEIDVEAYKHVTNWAEPDIDSAAQALRTLYTQPDIRLRLGQSGKAFISKYFSAENFRRSIHAFIGSEVYPS